MVQWSFWMLMTRFSLLQLLIKTVDPAIEARTLKAIKVCESYIYVIDNVLLPTADDSITSVPPVNATFLQALIGLGNDASTATSSSGGFGTVTDPVSYFPYPDLAMGILNRIRLVKGQMYEAQMGATAEIGPHTQVKSLSQ